MEPVILILEGSLALSPTDYACIGGNADQNVKAALRCLLFSESKARNVSENPAVWQGPHKNAFLSGI